MATAKRRRVGGSTVVAIPPVLLKQLNLAADLRVTLTVEKKPTGDQTRSASASQPFATPEPMRRHGPFASVKGRAHFYGHATRRQRGNLIWRKGGSGDLKS